MTKEKLKFVFIAALMACMVLLSICGCNSCQPTMELAIQDTTILNQWRREKAQKLEVISQYEARVKQLQASKDSLQSVLNAHKQALTAYRFKEKFLQGELKQKLSPKPSALRQTNSNLVHRDSIAPLIDSLIEASDKSDMACDSTIQDLENTVANRDSTILCHTSIEAGLRDIHRTDELQNQYLTERLNTACKEQKKRTRQNRLLKGGLLFLAGLTAPLVFKATH